MEVSHQQLFRVDKPLTRAEPKLLIETQTERVDASYKAVEKTDKTLASHLDKQRKQAMALAAPEQTAVDPVALEAIEGQNDDSSPNSGLANQGQDQTQAQLRADQAVIQHLKLRDQEVRAHEQAHASVGGQYAGSASFSYIRGPNGSLYATGGEVGIDTSPIAGDPQATLQKARQVQAAALAPLNPSTQDRAVAARAGQMAVNAMASLASERIETARQAASDFIERKGQGDSESIARTDADSDTSGKSPDRSENQVESAVSQEARNLYREVSVNRAGPGVEAPAAVSDLV